MDAKIRLFIDDDLAADSRVALNSSQTHYLKNVMRLDVGGLVLLFNGRDGEWRAEIKSTGKKDAVLSLQELVRAQADEAEIWLLFAPVKKTGTNMIAEKATELGVTHLWPVITDHTNVERVKIDRLKANVIEAAEQCRRLTVPTVLEPEKLSQVLSGWNEERRLIVMDETGGGDPLAEILRHDPAASFEAILIGPEGGFARSELDAMGNLPFVTFASLGDRILRAETAAVASLAIWQALARG